MHVLYTSTQDNLSLSRIFTQKSEFKVICCIKMQFITHFKFLIYTTIIVPINYKGCI